MIHIHNGDLVAESARRSDIPGEHMPFREALLTGPVPRDVDVETRAQFLAETTREPLLRVRNDLLDQQRALDAAAQQDEVVLWFEHDLFCLINLLSLLNRFASHKRLSIVWNPQPLSEVDLTLLFGSRAAVTPGMIKSAKSAWAAYTSPDPTAINPFLRRDVPDFPFLRDGMTLHAARFPSTLDGLGIVEKRILTLVSAGTGDFLTLFSRFDADPPRLGLGDAEVLRTLRSMANRPVPLVTLAEEDTMPPKVLIALTPAAENVLNGSVDYLSVNDPDHWLGGVHLTRENVWRFDNDRREILNPSAG